MSDSVAVAVQQVAATITLSPASLPLLVRDTVRLTATAADSGAAQITDPEISWTSSSAAAATVNGGLVTATGTGTAQITAAAGTARASIGVTVREPLVASAIDGGNAHTCAVSGSRTYCWGANTTRQLGFVGAGVAVPTEVPSVASYVAVSAGGIYTRTSGSTCGLTASGTVYCWGNDTRRQLSGSAATEECRLSSNTRARCRETQEAVTGLGGVTQVSTGQSHTCAINSSGAAYCWGSNIYGALGTPGPLTESCGDMMAGWASGPCSTTPVPVTGGHSFRQLSVGTDFACGVTQDGAGYCWGRNDTGQLGVSGTSSSPTPVAVQGGHGFSSISAGELHACGVVLDGRVLCWGSNRSGQLGIDGVREFTATPTVIEGDVTFRSISVSLDHGCGIGTDGRAYCWGNPESGKTGSGSAQAFTPAGFTRVVGGRLFTSITVGTDHSCAIEAGTNRVYCWGFSGVGATGSGYVGPLYTPAVVTTTL